MQSADYERIKNTINAENRFLDFCQLRIDHIEDGLVKASLQAIDQSLNIYGMVHGGALFTLADMAAGVCALTDASRCVTLDSSIHFLKAAREGRVLAIAHRIHAGKTIGVYDVRIEGEDGRLYGQATFTMFLFHDE